MISRYSDVRKVRVLTPHTYELIGKIVTKASLLKFSIFFMASSAKSDLESSFVNYLKSRRTLLKNAKLAFDKCDFRIEASNLISSEKFSGKLKTHLLREMR